MFGVRSIWIDQVLGHGLEQAIARHHYDDLFRIACQIHSALARRVSAADHNTCRSLNAPASVVAAP